MSALSDPRQHDDLLNFRLKRLLTLGGAPAIRLCEGQFGVSRAEWRVTAALVERGTMSPTELAEHTHMEAARVSRMVKLLTEKGFVQRTGGAGDRRRAMLEATTEGHALYRGLFPQLAKINRRLMAVLNEEEAVLLEQFLARLTENAEAIRAEGGGVEVKTPRYLGGTRRFW